jgi:hypothetical protein
MRHAKCNRHLASVQPKLGLPIERAGRPWAQFLDKFASWVVWKEQVPVYPLVKKICKNRLFLFPGNKFFFGVHLKLGLCKRIASVAQRRSTGTPQRPPVPVFKWVPERGPVARSNVACHETHK